MVAAQLVNVPSGSLFRRNNDAVDCLCARNEHARQLLAELLQVLQQLSLHRSWDRDMKSVRIDEDDVGLLEFSARRAQNAVANGFCVDDETEPHYEVQVDFDRQVNLTLAVYFLDVVGNLAEGGFLQAALDDTRRMLATLVDQRGGYERRCDGFSGVDDFFDTRDTQHQRKSMRQSL